MTHDWFSHTDEGTNTDELKPVGCDSAEAKSLGCRPNDRYEASIFVKTDEPETFQHEGETLLKRSAKTTNNLVTAWWDASQIYGYNETSEKRVLRDPADSAKLLMKDDYLTTLPNCEAYSADCPVQSVWQGQESAAFPANWNIGLSFYHNVFSREHNRFVDAFRAQQKQTPDADSGLRNPSEPDEVISYEDVTDERLFQVGRLIVSAEIAKIHTIEWTTQLLYNDPLYKGMNSNWFGLFNLDEDRASKVLRRITGSEKSLFSRIATKLSRWLGRSENAKGSGGWYSIFASGAGIFGLGNTRNEGMLWWKKDAWDLSNLEEDVNGGINHFGSPFNFPEEFPSVYRLHTLVPIL